MNNFLVVWNDQEEDISVYLEHLQNVLIFGRSKRENQCALGAVLG